MLKPLISVVMSTAGAASSLESACPRDLGPAILRCTGEDRCCIGGGGTDAGTDEGLVGGGILGGDMGLAEVAGGPLLER